MSYYRMFGLECEPFSTSPDPSFFYESKNHKAALASLMIELRLRRGLCVVLGEVGTGKTTLGRKLIQMLKEREEFVFHLILDPTYASAASFLKALARVFGIPAPGLRDALDAKGALERYLYDTGAKQNKTVVLILDEAQKLSAESLEILRVLLNYETNEFKLLQVVLLGQTELLENLFAMPNLLDRISLKCALRPLTEEQTREMIDYRLAQAGHRGPERIFADEAVREIHRLTGGYPRRIAMLCHQALKEAVMKQRRPIQRDIIEEIIAEEVREGWHRPILLQKSSS